VTAAGANKKQEYRGSESIAKSRKSQAQSKERSRISLDEVALPLPIDGEKSVVIL
jgi:hypothetical protein